MVEESKGPSELQLSLQAAAAEAAAARDRDRANEPASGKEGHGGFSGKLDRLKRLLVQPHAQPTPSQTHPEPQPEPQLEPAQLDLDSDSDLLSPSQRRPHPIPAVASLSEPEKREADARSGEDDGPLEAGASDQTAGRAREGVSQESIWRSMWAQGALASTAEAEAQALKGKLKPGDLTAFHARDSMQRQSHLVEPAVRPHALAESGERTGKMQRKGSGIGREVRALEFKIAKLEKKQVRGSVLRER